MSGLAQCTEEVTTLLANADVRDSQQDIKRYKQTNTDRQILTDRYRQIDTEDTDRTVQADRYRHTRCDL